MPYITGEPGIKSRIILQIISKFIEFSKVVHLPPLCSVFIRECNILGKNCALLFLLLLRFFSRSFLLWIFSRIFYESVNDIQPQFTDTPCNKRVQTFSCATLFLTLVIFLTRPQLRTLMFFYKRYLLMYYANGHLQQYIPEKSAPVFFYRFALFMLTF